MPETIIVYQEWPVPVMSADRRGVLVHDPDGQRLGCYTGTAGWETWERWEDVPPEVRAYAEQLWTEHQEPQPLTGEELQKVGFEAAGWPVNPEKGRTWSRAVVIADRERQAEIKAYRLKQDGDALEMLNRLFADFFLQADMADRVALAITALKKERGAK